MDRRDHPAAHFRRLRQFRRLTSLAAAVWVALAAGAAPAQPPAAVPAPVVDAHMHIQTPALSAELAALARKAPEMFKEMDPGMLSPRTGEDAVKQLDAAGIPSGDLLSEAYMWTSRSLKISAKVAAARTRSEDAYNVEAAVRSHGRLKAYIGVNPLWGGALDEMRFWAGKPGVGGVKIHLANSGFNPQAKADVDRLAAVFRTAHALNLPIAIHVRSAKTYSAADAAVFIDRVLPDIGDTPIQIAHSGGWGGLDHETVDALKLYAEAIARQAPGTRRLQFDLALIVVDDHTDPALAREFAELMRKIGLDRFVFGSDWPALYTPARYESLLVSQIPLTPAEWRTVFATPVNR